MTEYPIFKSFTFELIGAFALSYCAYFPKTEPDPEVKLLENQLIRPLIGQMLLWMGLIWISYRASGSQFTPAISVSMLASGNLSLTNFFVNLAGQLVGIFLGIISLKFTLTKYDPHFNVNFNFLLSIFVEFLFGFFVCLAYHCTAISKTADKSVYGFVVPATFVSMTMSLSIFYFSAFSVFTYAVEVLFSPKPFSHLLWFSIGSFGGAAVAGLFYRFLLENENDKEIANDYVLNEENDIKF